jgi:hypothetical protein
VIRAARTRDGSFEEVILEGGLEIEDASAVSGQPDVFKIPGAYSYHRKAREEAKIRGLKARGTLGVIVQGYRANLVNLDEVEALFEAIISHDQIWIAEGLCRQVLRRLQAERPST